MKLMRRPQGRDIHSHIPRSTELSPPIEVISPKMTRPCQGLKERLMESGKLCATLFQGQMGGFTKAKGGQVPQPKLEREEVIRFDSIPRAPGF